MSDSLTHKDHIEEIGFAVGDIAANGLGFDINHALGFSIGIPYNKEKVNDGRVYRNFDETTSVRMKLHSQPESSYITFLLSPIISVDGSNVIAKRSIMKSSDQTPRRGSVKERWATEDYSVTIDGILVSEDENKYPADEISDLRVLCEAREPIDIECELLEPYEITRIVIESYSFPFTKGLPYQRFTIKATSDEDFELLIK